MVEHVITDLITECIITIGLYHPLDGITNHKSKLLCFLQLFLPIEEGTGIGGAIKCL